MEHIEDHAGSEGARGMPFVGCDIKELARLQDVGDTRDCELEGAAHKQRPLLVQVGVIGDDGARSDINAALSNMIGVDVAARLRA